MSQELVSLKLVLSDLCLWIAPLSSLEINWLLLEKVNRRLLRIFFSFSFHSQDMVSMEFA